MTTIDVFNGDADGICALLQLRNSSPCESTLITGIKRDIKLLERVNAGPDDNLTILDISLDKNRDDLLRNINNGAKALYVDHHFAGEIPQHKNLTALINTEANICTSLLINQYLNNQNKQPFPLWAITGTFGDNLAIPAQALAQQQSLSSQETQLLQSLGIFINYNGYGASVDDLHFAPDQLYQKLLPYQNPLEFIHDKDSIYTELKAGYEQDNANAINIKPEYQTDKVALFILPGKTWARRISGVYSNDLANQYPDRAHAVLTYNNQGGFVISVRAPLNNKTGADELCRKFATGGGRKAAAGINHLPETDLQKFIDQFTRQFT